MKLSRQAVIRIIPLFVGSQDRVRRDTQTLRCPVTRCIQITPINGVTNDHGINVVW